MKIISSRQNPDFKKLKAIASDPRARRTDQACWLEGERLCTAYLDTLNQNTHPSQTAVGVGESFQAPVLVTTPDQSEALQARYGARLGDLWVLDSKCFGAISQVASPSGWGLVIPLPSNTIGDRLDVTAPRQKSNHDLPDLVVLDRITDPGNAGAIIRSAAAAGIGVVWCVGPHVDMWSPKVLRSAMGGHFALRIIEDVAEADALSQLVIRGPQLLATALTSNAISLYAPTLNLKQPTAWVFGQEAHGVSPGILKQATAVRIPQDACVESLNVAASAAVCLFEMRRQRLAAMQIA